MGKNADGDRHRAPLAIDVASEASQGLDAEGEVEFVPLFELAPLPLVRRP